MLFTFIGTVCKGFVNPPTTGESSSTCTIEQRKWGLLPECYNIVVDVLTPKTEGEVDVIMAQSAKDLALLFMVGNIESKMGDENLKSFTYKGQIYKADKSNIQATQNESLSMDGALPIRTMIGTAYEGTWPSESGSVSFTAEDFISFASGFFIRGSNNFTTRTGHIFAVTEIYNDENKTAQDVLDYDYSGGWN